MKKNFWNPGSIRDVLKIVSKKKSRENIVQAAVLRLVNGNYIDYIIVLLLIGDILVFGRVLTLYTETQKIERTIPTKNTYAASEFPDVTAQNPLEISADSAIVYEKNSRVVVFKKNSDFRFSPASSAKIMTAIVALEYYRPNDILEASHIDRVDGSKMGLAEGEKMTVEHLLYGLLLPSGNDAAYVLSQRYPGGQDGFVAAMNRKAKELKLYNTYFVDPSGYEDGNYTTAYDLARLASYAMDNPSFASIVKTKRAVISDVSGAFRHTLSNLNELLNDRNVIGIKTGYTDEAGGVLVSALRSYNGTFIIVVMKSLDRFADSRTVISRVVENVKLIRF